MSHATLQSFCTLLLLQEPIPSHPPKIPILSMLYPLRPLLLIALGAWLLLAGSSCTVFRTTTAPAHTKRQSIRATDTISLTSLPLPPVIFHPIIPPEFPSSLLQVVYCTEEAPHVAPQFYAVVQPVQALRNDSEGEGHFGASRGRRTHNGIDLLVTPGGAVYCPIEGYMERVAYPYGTTRRNKKWLGCAIQGTGLYRGYEVKIFYMEPFLLGEYVYPNDIIGKAQAISDRYSSQMKNHLHVEVRYQGELIDPDVLFQVIK